MRDCWKEIDKGKEEREVHTRESGTLFREPIMQVWLSGLCPLDNERPLQVSEQRGALEKKVLKVIQTMAGEGAGDKSVSQRHSMPSRQHGKDPD